MVRHSYCRIGKGPMADGSSHQATGKAVQLSALTSWLILGIEGLHS